nr:hypothetical protein [uncultured Pseudomonas sp.]
MYVESAGLIAGKPAPTGIGVVCRFLGNVISCRNFMLNLLASQHPQVLGGFADFVGNIILCGSWLASDSNLSGTKNVMDELICNLI